MRMGPSCCGSCGWFPGGEATYCAYWSAGKCPLYPAWTHDGYELPPCDTNPPTKVCSGDPVTLGGDGCGGKSGLEGGLGGFLSARPKRANLRESHFSISSRLDGLEGSLLFLRMQNVHQEFTAFMRGGCVQGGTYHHGCCSSLPLLCQASAMMISA